MRSPLAEGVHSDLGVDAFGLSADGAGGRGESAWEAGAVPQPSQGPVESGSDPRPAFVRFGSVSAREVQQVSSDPADLDSGGFWAVVITFEGQFQAVRMTRDLVDDPIDEPGTPISQALPPPGPTDTSAWRSSLGRSAYEHRVRQLREAIAAGEVYQVNLCRVLDRQLPPGLTAQHLADGLQAGNPAPHAARLWVPQAGWDIVSASPELFLRRRGERITTAPIKGTAVSAAAMLPKDHSENVMITDLMRNDLSPLCHPGTVEVTGLCEVQQHPGLVHLVSTVTGRLRAGLRWSQILDSTMPPGSVSGAPKSTALQQISRLEPVARGPYCGAIGWVDADRDEAELAVGIRTFWSEPEGAERRLRFGTGAGITWASEPAGEWWETELKAQRLVALADAAVERAQRIPGQREDSE
ncbi:chorismate-binding protein [Dermacoccaceae bacterium W4C1]